MQAEQMLSAIAAHLLQWPDEACGPGHIVFSDDHVTDQDIGFAIRSAESFLCEADAEAREGAEASLALLRVFLALPEGSRREISNEGWRDSRDSRDSRDE